MAISAQGGPQAASPGQPRDGNGGEIQAMVDAPPTEGSGYVPGVVAFCHAPRRGLRVGLQGAAELGLIGVTGRDGMSAAGITEASYLWVPTLGSGGVALGSPEAGPKRGPSPSDPLTTKPLPGFLASASTRGKTGQDTQKILHGIAGGVRKSQDPARGDWWQPVARRGQDN